MQCYLQFEPSCTFHEMNETKIEIKSRGKLYKWPHLPMTLCLCCRSEGFLLAKEKATVLYGAAYGIKCYLQRIISILKGKKKMSIFVERPEKLLQTAAQSVTNLFLPESRKPLANGLRSIFSLVICRRGEHGGDFGDYCSLKWILTAFPKHLNMQTFLCYFAINCGNIKSCKSSFVCFCLFVFSLNYLEGNVIGSYLAM